MAGYDDVMDGLRRRVRQVIGNNAVALAPHGLGPSTKAPTPPEKQLWNFAAKKAAGERIADEELDRSFQAAGPVRPHNNEFDAMRHARWSQRMASEIGPVFSAGAGLWHEAGNISDGIGQNIEKRLDPKRFPHPEQVPTIGETMAESAMDLRNNFEGIGAALRHRPIKPANLQTRPGVSASAYGR